MSSNQQPPAERASEIINNLPSSPNLITKTGSVVLGTGLLATAISQELYVVNEETFIAIGFAILATFIARVRVFLPASPGFRRSHLLMFLAWVWLRNFVGCARFGWDVEHAAAIQGVG